MQLKDALMTGQEMSSTEADEAIEDMKEQVLAGDDPDEVLYEYGLEPDYIFEII